MIDEARPYAEYKSTEVPWLGDIPAHWEVRPLRTLLKQRNEKNRPLKTRQILSLSIAHGVTLYSHEGRGGNKSKSDLTAYKIARKGDIVLNSMNVVVGAVGLSKYTGAISPVYYALYPLSDNVDIHYYNAVFSNHTFQRYLLIYGKGILIKEGDSGKLNTIRMKISSDDLKTIPLPLPTPEEQTAIARFLNWKTVQVKRFIRNRRRLIEVLSEQKQAIINRAVTRGLDPNTPLKPSGIDWLGDIPEHWEVKSLRQLGRFTKGSGGSREDDVAEGLPCIRYGHIYMYFNFTVSAVRTYVSESRARDYARIKHGDVLFTASGEDMSEIGKSVVNLIEEEVCCGGDVIILRPRIVAHSPFLGYASDAWHARCQKARLGRGTTVKHIYGDQLKKVCIAVPPKDEQVAIAEHIRQATSEATSLIDRAQREIDLIREYHTRLISDVVTGKMDIRHFAPPPGGEDLEEMVEAFEPLDDDPGELDEEIMDGEVSHADD